MHKHWSHREDSLLDDHEATGGHAVLDRAVTHPERAELLTRDAIELLRRELCHLSVPHRSP